MREDYRARYGELSARHWWWRARRSWLRQEIRARWHRSIGRSLVVGCGPGHEIPWLAERGDVVAVEPEGELVSADARACATILEVDFEPGLELPGRFDLIVMADVLEHLSRPGDNLRYALALLREEGRVLATVPAFPLLWTSHDEINEHRARYTRSSFRRLSADAGMELETLRYFFHWTFPVKLAQRAVEAVLGLSAGPPSVPSAPLNDLLYGITRLEQKLVTPLRPPFGTSLFALGRRKR